ncbi:MAG: helix-turn-helix domain-containing protein [Pseudomonadota bacterium]
MSLIHTLRISQVEDWGDADGDDWRSRVLQLASGPMDATARIIDLDGVHLHWNRIGARAMFRDVYVGPQLIFGFPIAAPEPVLYRGRAFEPRTVAVWGSHLEQMHEYICPSGTRSLLVAVDTDLADLLGWEVSEPLGRTGRNPGLQRLIQTCRRATRAAERSSGADMAPWREQILDDLEAALGPAVLAPSTADLSQADSKSFRLVRQFEGLFATPTAEAMATADSVAAHLGVSRRSLFKAFRQWPGMAPARYLRLIRLHQLRASLIGADPEQDTVTHLSSAHGFTQFGRLAATYRATFGELPSQTLRRARPGYKGAGRRPSLHRGRPQALAAPFRDTVATNDGW